MAGCEQGYLCDVCGEEVVSIADSELYLRYVTGRLPVEALPGEPERHLLCSPVLAQFIAAAPFSDITVDGPFSRHRLDPATVAEQTELLTRGWKRLQELAESSEPVSLADYPLPEFRKSAP